MQSVLKTLDMRQTCAGRDAEVLVGSELGLLPTESLSLDEGSPEVAGREAPLSPPPVSLRGGESASGRATVRRSSAVAARTPKTASPEEWLARAMAADSPRTRGLRARRGLACPQRLDRTTQALLLRQLSLACLELGQFSKAVTAASQALHLGVLVDVLHQDTARAHLANGSVEAAVQHLRWAERSAPAHRRALHAWTLGATLHLAGRPREALPALERAVRWGTTGRPLFEAHLALVRCDLGERLPGPSGLEAVSQRLLASPVSQGYGRFLLGELAWRVGRLDEAQAWLEEFLARATSGRPALALSLEAEARRARQTLARIVAARG